MTAEVNIKLKNNDDRDVLILYLQSMINNKSGGRPSVNQQSENSIFGKPQRLPQQLDESMLYDPKSIQFNKAGRGRVSSNDFSVSQIQSYPEDLMAAQPMYAKPLYAVQQNDMRDSYVRPASIGLDNYSPRGSEGSYKPNYIAAEEQPRRMITDRDVYLHSNSRLTVQGMTAQISEQDRVQECQTTTTEGLLKTSS